MFPLGWNPTFGAVLLNVRYPALNGRRVSERQWSAADPKPTYSMTVSGISMLPTDRCKCKHTRQAGSGTVAGMEQSNSIETSRLILRVYGVEDFDEMFEMWSEPAVTRFMGSRKFSREDVWARLLRYAGTWALFDYGFWVVRDKRSGQFIGEAGFHNLQREIEPPFGDCPELGFGLISAAHGKGFATEAAQAVLDWADRAWGERETVCMIAPDNVPSLRIADKLGYVRTAQTEYNGAPMILFKRGGRE